MVSFEIGGGENVPGVCAAHNIAYQVRGPRCLVTSGHIPEHKFISIIPFIPIGLSGRRGIVIACICPSVCQSVCPSVRRPRTRTDTDIDPETRDGLLAALWW